MTISGVVQGVGFRPFVFRLARELSLTGWIANASEGVVVELEGRPEAVDLLLERLRTAGPPSVRIDRMEALSVPPIGDGAFTIQPSSDDGAQQLAIAPDLAACAQCLHELFDPEDRRHRYPWLSCAQCGPRFSMATGLPYDRATTTMAAFGLCHACRAEFETSGDRRFHAESTACPACGPRLSYWDKAGHEMAQEEEALARICEILRHGGIVAIKGIGGFHLWVDAANDEAVAHLRARKKRPHKPFAVMFPSLDAVRESCAVSPDEAQWLSSPQAPIVILNQLAASSLARAVGPETGTVGVMLPYAPLHHLLMKELDRPMVATSGNRSEEPIVTDEGEAVRRLSDLADAFLIHDRPIARPMDDSVLRMARSGPIIMRRARGLVPRTIRLPHAVAEQLQGPVLALGGHLKNTVALLHEDRVVLSQHLGDLSTLETETAVRQAIEDLQWLLRVTPRVLACDLHPDYRSTRLAEELAARWAVPLVRVQHHHAHVASCMAEQGVTEALGVAWDGAGYGTDGSIWGGEWLAATYHDCRRVASLHPFRLPGGEQAIREPRRTALAVRWETFGSERAYDHDRQTDGWEQQKALLLAMLQKQRLSPVTTSMGRLFDALASMLNLCHMASFEGQAAMAVEEEAWRASASIHMDDVIYPIPVISDPAAGPWRADWRPMIDRIAKELHDGTDRSRIAYRFHRSLAELIGQVAQLAGRTSVALTGGCFQNTLLVDLAKERLTAAGFEVLTHREVPPNDGGLSLGQAVIAAARLGSRDSTDHLI